MYSEAHSIIYSNGLKLDLLGVRCEFDALRIPFKLRI